MNLKPKFNVGDRVRVRIATDVIPEEKILCDVGFVEKVMLIRRGTPYERITYWVRLDGIYAARQYICDIGPLVTVSEGFNVGPHNKIERA